MPQIKGFSKLTKTEKLKWITQNYFHNPEEAYQTAAQYWNTDSQLQQLHDEFIENTISNFYLPLGIAPNFLINGTQYTLPMAIEESSVVAAAAKAAKYWAERGGFTAQVKGVEKIGQVHFTYTGNPKILFEIFETHKNQFFTDTHTLTHNMQQRGGGITQITLLDQTHKLPHYYQLHATFNTQDSMGANFINSCLEQFAKTLQQLTQGLDVQIIMSILSNYVPNCLVKAQVSCPIPLLKDNSITDPYEFAEKFVTAVQIAQVEPYRAVTHNKGIMNGIDAVVVATGNDFRAIEAGVHAYASRNGQYTSLSYAQIHNQELTFGLEVPLALGTVGGLTSLHPLVKFSLNLLQQPTAPQLMQIVATAGLAQNFAALKSLTTTGIQKGHMKMHLANILNQYQATPEERKKVYAHFAETTLSHRSVVDYLQSLRK